MNAERLHVVLLSLQEEMTKSHVTDKMQNLIDTLRAVVNNPHPAAQQNLSNSLKAAYQALTDTPTDNFSPTWRQILEDIGGAPLCGRHLKESVENIFSRNQITPAVALGELEELHVAVQILARQRGLVFKRWF
jgi:hypothetical protein